VGVRTRFVEATQSREEGFNHGKFLVGWPEPEEWGRRSVIDADTGADTSLLRRCGWSPDHLLVADLATGEGAFFLPGGMPGADLVKHRVWVCPMFEPFLAWLYDFLRDEPPEMLPAVVELPGVPPTMQGYRRPGPEGP
jgi:hypothetical protein